MDFTSILYRLKHGRRLPAEAAAVRSNPTATTGDGAPGNVPLAHPGATVLSREAASARKPTPNYIVAGRREFTDQFMNLARGKRNWQLAAFAALGLLAAVTVAYIALASSARVQLLVVETDELGQVRAFREVGDVYSAREAVTDATLRMFVRNLRTIYQDPAAQRDLVVSAYAFADASVQEWLNGYFSNPEHDPRLLMRQVSRRVEVKSVIQVPESDSWKLTWVEIETPHGTDTQKRSAWEAYLTVKQVSGAVRDFNPLGLYVTAINWTQVTGSPASR